MYYFLKNSLLILIIFTSSIRAMDTSHSCKRVKLTEFNPFDRLPSEMVKSIVNNFLDGNFTDLANLSEADKRFYFNNKKDLTALKELYNDTNKCLTEADFPIKAAANMGTYVSLQWLKNQVAKDPNMIQELNEVLQNLLNINIACNMTEQKENKIIFLIKAGADINTQSTNNKDTALILAACSNNEKMVKFLLNYDKQKVDPNIKNSSGNTALSAISHKFYKKIAQLLLAAKANPNIHDNFGDTALMKAARTGHKEIVQLLLKAGANINAQNPNGQTALMYAAFMGHKNIVELLIEFGANPNIKNSAGDTAIHFALSSHRNNKKKEIVELLEKYTANFNK